MRSLWRGLLGYVLLATSVALLWDAAAILLGLLLLLSVLTLAALRSRRRALFWLVGAVLGPVAESLAILRGAWHYTGVDLIPVWLPPAWGLAAVYLDLIVEGLLPNRGRPA